MQLGNVLIDAPTIHLVDRVLQTAQLAHGMIQSIRLLKHFCLFISS